jgi:hypothetical protein
VLIFIKPKGLREQKNFGKHWYSYFHGAEFLTENSSSDSQKIPSFFIEIEISVPFSILPVICPYSEPDQSSPCPSAVVIL